MAGEWKTLKQRLDEATDRLGRATDPEAKPLLDERVRELERLVELAADVDPTAPQIARTRPPREGLD